MIEGDDEDLDDEEICDDETNAHAAYNDRTSETVWLQQQQQQQQSSPPKLSLLAGSVAASPPWTAEQCSQSHSSFSSTTTPTRIGDNETARSAGNVILQLSSTGGVHPVPLCVATATGATTTQEEKRKPSTVLHEGAEGLIPEDNVVDDKSENGTDPVPKKLESVLTTATNSFFRVHWDFDPLLQHVQQEGSLLALHIACFYSASAEVLNALVEAHPLAALSDVVGMLPIHFVAAGWSIQPLLPAPSTLIPTLIPQHIPSPTSCSEGGPLERLKVLQRVVPDSVRVRSGNHGMTPVDYIHECMDEGSYKETCLRILQQGLISTTKDSSPFLQIDTSTTNSSDGVCSFVDTTNSSAEDVTDNSGEMYQAYSHGSESSFSCLSTLVAERNWERLLTELELNPSLASKWTFGVDPASASIYKRLPLHCACAYGAPIGLISNLIQCHPDGAAAIDARDISTPLSLACFAGASVAIIRLLLYTYPKAIAIENAYGQVPLHVAVLSKVCYDTIELLVEQSPHLVLLSDNDGQSPINYAKKIYGEKDPVYHFLVMIELVLQNEADTI
jgi:Ankyrin repeats (3 copies)